MQPTYEPHGFYVSSFFYRTNADPKPSTEPHPTCPGQGRRGGSRPLATHQVTHTARQRMTVCLLPRFRKEVALSTIPDEKENGWRKKN